MTNNVDWVYSSINERIKYLCDTYFAGNVSEMAKNINTKRSTLRDIIGERASAPSYETMKNIVDNATIPVNPEWLLMGIGGISRFSGMRESDNYLYHCSDSFDGLVSILKNKIKPQFSDENFEYLEDGHKDMNYPEKISYPMFCLCDIPKERISQHRNKYGRYVIGFKKEWAAGCDFVPIHYIRKGSSVSKYLTELTNYFLDKKDSDGEFTKARNAFTHLSFYWKSYEDLQTKERYYDEKEWRWTPDIDLVLGLKCSGNAEGVEYFSNQKKHCQEQINRDDKILGDFTFEDISFIGLTSEDEKERLLSELTGHPFLESLKVVIYVLPDISHSIDVRGQSEPLTQYEPDSIEGTHDQENIDYKEKFLSLSVKMNEIYEENRQLRIKLDNNQKKSENAGADSGASDVQKTGTGL